MRALSGWPSRLPTTCWTRKAIPSTSASRQERMPARARQHSSRIWAFPSRARCSDRSPTTPSPRSSPSEGGRQRLRKQPISSPTGAADRSRAHAAGTLSSRDQVFMTGASGFVGSAIARALIRSGFAVRALVRPSSPRTNLNGLDIAIAEGDMRDPAAVARAVKGARYVFHVAADYRLWARRPDDIEGNNVEGTRVVIEAARAAGVERIVYTSSVATLNPAQPGCSADETMPLAEAEAIGSYKRSKIAAERLVESMIADDGLPMVIVNPTAPIGPRDVRPTPTGRIIIEAASGHMPAFVDTGLNLVHVDDVAAGHLAALHRGRIGERYILGGENMALAEMLAR